MELKWILLPPHKSPVIIEQHGVELKLFFKHTQKSGKIITASALLFRAQLRYSTRPNVIDIPEWKGSEEATLKGGEKILNDRYISIGKTYYSLDSPFLQEHFNQKGQLASYGAFSSLEEIKLYAEKEYGHIFHNLLFPEETYPKANY